MNDVLDTTAQIMPTTPVGNPTDGATPSGTPVPVSYDNDPKVISAMQAEKNLSSFLSDNGYESLEDAISDLESGRSLKGALGDRDVLQTIADAETLAKYNAHWAEQEAMTMSETQDPHDKVTALEKRLNDLISGQERERREQQERETAKRVVDQFGNEVNSYIARQETVPEEYRGFVAKLSGVGNRFNEIDVTDKVAVRAMLNSHLKEVSDFEQAVIKRYRDGKIAIPKISPTTPVDPADKREPIKNTRDAGKALLAKLMEVKKARENQP